MKIYCNACKINAECRLTDGREIYPHRKDLADLPFWVHDLCGNYVGCHHKTDDRTKPLGSIPTEETRKARVMVHRYIDPLWRSGQISRRKLYGKLSKHIGKTYHTANIVTLEQARDVCDFVRKLMEQQPSNTTGKEK